MAEQKQLTDPIEILIWIREHWSNLKASGDLELAITKYLKASGDEDKLTVQDVIDIEESANQFLNVKKKEN